MQHQQPGAHDDPDTENDTEEQKKNYFGPSKFYCTETACYPCGVAIGWALFDQSESPTKILAFLEKLFPTPDSKPNYICIDKGCQVLRTALSNGSYETTWMDTRFIVDTYHYSNHKTTDTLCQTWCNPTPSPDIDPNLVIQVADSTGELQWKRVFNTQASEQLNAWLASYNPILKRMTIFNFCWYLHSILFIHSKRIIERQEDCRRNIIQELDPE